MAKPNFPSVISILSAICAPNGQGVVFLHVQCDISSHGFFPRRGNQDKGKPLRSQAEAAFSLSKCQGFRRFFPLVAPRYFRMPLSPLRSNCVVRIGRAPGGRSGSPLPCRAYRDAAAFLWRSEEELGNRSRAIKKVARDFLFRLAFHLANPSKSNRNFTIPAKLW